MNESKTVEVIQFLQVAGPMAVAALPDVEGALNFPRTYQDAQVPLQLMREEGTKTAGILKGLAAATTEKISVRR